MLPEVDQVAVGFVAIGKVVLGQGGDGWSGVPPKRIQAESHACHLEVGVLPPYITSSRRHALSKTRFTRAVAAAMLALSLSGLAATGADARRGGSFGSRGSRTYVAPRSTYGSPGYVAPVERSMTPRSPAQPSRGYDSGYAQNAPYRSPGSRFGGFGGGLIGGLVAGGLIGDFFGGGWNAGGGHGGGGGYFSALIQLAVIGGLIWLLLGIFRRRQPQPQGQPMMRDSFAGYAPPPSDGPWGGPAAPDQPASDPGTDIPITASDQRDFERLLLDVQDAFGREDYARLRQLTTPEIMSYLSEELSQNATRGLRNEVTNTRLLAAEVSEAWREAGGDYATIAMRYESRDVMLDRATGAIRDMAQGGISETLEYWTFVRGPDGVWKLSAIQET
jgi:predicted lipid-binding transport protein (Tim44 family)